MSKAKNETLVIKRREGESEADTVGRYALTPDLQAAATLTCYAMPGMDDASLGALTKELQAQADAANRDDFTRAEAMLVTQAHTLDAIFNDMARRSSRRETVDSMATYLKLALKAQSQCRNTLEALAEIKAPKAVAFVRQANIAQGHQQVNNGPQADTDKPSRARTKPKSAKQTNQVAHHEQQPLDTGRQSKTGEADTAMAAVDAIDRAENGRR